MGPGRPCARLRAAILALRVFVVSPMISAPSAMAEVEHPCQEWLRRSTAGLFLHWGMFTEPKHLSCAEWERDVTAGGWTPDYWAGDNTIRIYNENDSAPDLDRISLGA